MTFGFSGQAVRQKMVPKFTDIIKYLDYLQLDEPIIGEYVFFLSFFFQKQILNFSCKYFPICCFLLGVLGLSCLEEVPNPDPQLGPKFMCRLCKHPAILTDMVCHVIGRKHRQKYVVNYYYFKYSTKNSLSKIPIIFKLWCLL